MHPAIQAGLTLLAQRVSYRIVETDRSAERQRDLYEQGRSRPGQIVTHARPYESAHQWGLAVDVEPVPATNSQWAKLRKEAQNVGFKLLGDWDPGHLEHPAFSKLLPQIRAWAGYR